jgi:hypothetical protein
MQDVVLITSDECHAAVSIAALASDISLRIRRVSSIEIEFPTALKALNAIPKAAAQRRASCSLATRRAKCLKCRHLLTEMSESMLRKLDAWKEFLIVCRLAL